MVVLKFDWIKLRWVVGDMDVKVWWNDYVIIIIGLYVKDVLC